MAIKVASKQVASLATATAGSTETAPIISSIVVSNPSFTTELDDTAIGTTGANVKIKGTGFNSNYNLTWNGANITSSSYFVSSNEIRANVPATGAGSYSFMLFNNASRAGAIYASVPVSGFPTWTTSAYSLATVANVSVQLLASGDAPLTYSLVSGTLPPNVTLSSSGLISGPNTLVGTYNFVVNVDDGQLQSTSQSITITVATVLAAGLWGWGYGNNGALGDNISNPGYTFVYSPVQTAAGGTSWLQVAASDSGAAGIKGDNTLWLWGSAWSGCLGDNTNTHKSSPVQTVAGGSTWKQITLGGTSVGKIAAAIKTDGTLWTWGNNFYGQLGDNTTIHRSSPVQTVGGGSTWRDITNAMMDHMSAIKTDGTLWLWGTAGQGQMGDNNTIPRSSPVQTVAGGSTWKEVSTFYAYTAAVKTDGTLWTWGFNPSGNLGDNTRISKSSPVQTVSGGTNWANVTAGLGITLAIKTDGTLWTWGNNYIGALGDNTIIDRSSPVQTISGGTSWKSIKSGYYSKIAGIKTDGTLWMWGKNDAFALGVNNSIPRSSPIQTYAGGTNWSKVAVGENVTFGITT